MAVERRRGRELGTAYHRVLRKQAADVCCGDIGAPILKHSIERVKCKHKFLRRIAGGVR